MAQSGSATDIRDGKNYMNYIAPILLYLVVDIPIYGFLVPYGGAFIGSWLLALFGTGGAWELLAVIAVTVMLTYVAFQLFGEPCYWKHLFAFETPYFFILQIRDWVNVGIMVYSLCSLFDVIQAMAKDKGIKETYVGEGMNYFAWKKFYSWFYTEAEVREMLVSGLPHSGTITDPNFGENEKFEHGGAFIIFWAMLAGSVTRLLYFNTLFTYIRAMEIFMSLKPTFEDDDDESDEKTMILSSSTLYRNTTRPISQMDNEIARAAKNASWET